MKRGKKISGALVRADKELIAAAVAAIKTAGGLATYDIDPDYALFSGHQVPAWRKRVAEYVGIDFVS